jgi:hypothetical protein
MSGGLIQYKTLTEPPALQPPGTRAWHQRFSEPTRRIALTAAVVAASSGITWTPQPISGPDNVRRISVVDASVPRQQSLLYRYPSTTDVFIFAAAETTTLDKWQSRFSEPTRKVAAQQFLSAWLPQPISGAGDVAISSTNVVVPYQRSLLYPSLADAIVTTAAETITTDKWQVPLSQPIRPRAQTGQPSFYFVKSEDVSADRWLQSLSLPTRSRLFNHSQSIIVKADPFAESVSIDKWEQPLSEPKRFAKNLNAHQQPYAYFVKVDPFPETVSADRWQQPLSEPTRRRGYPIQAQDELSFVGSDTATDARWFTPLSDPTRRKPIAEFPVLSWSEFTPAATEVVTLDKYFSWLTEPRRFPRELASHQQPYASFVQASPFAEAVSIDRWLRPLSDPTRRARVPDHPSLSLALSELVSADRWLRPLSDPTRRTRFAEYPSLSYAFVVAAPTETITLDKWIAELSRPILRKGLPAFEHPSFFFAQAAPFAEFVSVDRWQQPLSDPTRRIRFAEYPALSYVLAPTYGSGDVFFVSSNNVVPYQRTLLYQSLTEALFFVAETITLDKWMAEFSRPTLRKGPPAFEQPYFSLVKSAPFPETVSIDRWQQPLSVPTRRMRFAEHPSLSYLRFAEIVTLDKWLASLSQPVLRRGLGSFEHPSLFLVKAAPFPESVTADRWVGPLSQPTRRKVNVSSYMSPIFIAPTFQIEIVTFDKWFASLSQPTLRKVSYPTLASSSGEAPYVIFFYDDHTRPPRGVLTSRTDRNSIILRADPSAARRAGPPIAKRSEQTFRRGKPPNRKRDN